jgi:hypothetical protein
MMSVCCKLADYGTFTGKSEFDYCSEKSMAYCAPA